MSDPHDPHEVHRDVPNADHHAGANDGWKRLHPLSPLFHLFGLIKALLVTAVLVYFASAGETRELWIGVALVVAAAFHLYRHFVMRYRITDDDLIIRRGLIFRSERHIPIATINNVDIVQNIAARWLNVAEARLQTGSGGEAEATLKVLALDDIQRIRDRLANRTTASADTTGAEPLLRLTSTDLARLGLINNRGLVVFAALFGLAWQFDLFERLPDGEIIFKEVVAAAGPLSTLIAVALAIILFVALSITLSILRFSGFELRRVGDDFRLRCGLLTHRAATIPRRRVQLVSIRSTPLHRLHKRVGVRVETAGGTQDKNTVFGRLWFAPLATPAEADRVVREIGFPTPDSVDWQSLAPGAFRRKLKKTLIQSVPVAVLVAYLYWPWGSIIGAGLVVLAVVHAHADIKRTMWSATDDLIAFRSGVFFRKISLARPSASQVVTVAESPFDRRRGMAKLIVDTAGAGPAGHTIRIPYLTRRTADDGARRLAEAAAARPRVSSP